MLCAGVLATASPDRTLRAVGTLAYLLGVGSLYVGQHRIGMPPELRGPALAGKALLCGVALWIPIVLTTFFPSLQGNWWVASLSALAAAAIAAAIHRWQHTILRHQGRAAEQTPAQGAHE